MSCIWVSHGIPHAAPGQSAQRLGFLWWLDGRDAHLKWIVVFHITWNNPQIETYWSLLVSSFPESCGVFQCVAVCGSVWQCIAVCCRMWQCDAVCCSVSPITSNFFDSNKPENFIFAQPLNPRLGWNIYVDPMISKGSMDLISRRYLLWNTRSRRRLLISSSRKCPYHLPKLAH